MTGFFIITINKKFVFLPIILIFGFIILVLILCQKNEELVDNFTDPHSGIIVIDAGHGGVDGGTSYGNILEKDINLDIACRLRAMLEQNGYKVVMTREEDISLDKNANRGENRYMRDLNARVDIINNSNAQLFISIHVNSQIRNPSADGSIVFYGEKFEQSKMLAYFVQRPLNEVCAGSKKRITHNPSKASYYILKNAQIPGVLVEVAFITNPNEREELKKDTFRQDIAYAIAFGVEQYLKEINGSSITSY